MTAPENPGDILLDFSGVFRNLSKICNRALKVHRRRLIESEIRKQTVTMGMLLKYK